MIQDELYKLDEDEGGFILFRVDRIEDIDHTRHFFCTPVASTPFLWNKKIWEFTMKNNGSNLVSDGGRRCIGPAIHVPYTDLPLYIHWPFKYPAFFEIMKTL